MTGGNRFLSKAGWIRLGVIAFIVAVIETLCRTKVIDPLTMIPPSRIAIGLIKILAGGTMNQHILSTLINVATALSLAVSVGFVVGAVLFALPRARRVIDPLLVTYYAIPIFVFYPFFVVLFGLNRYPQIAIGFLLAVVAMIINTLNGFDRVRAFC